MKCQSITKKSFSRNFFPKWRSLLVTVTSNDSYHLLVISQVTVTSLKWSSLLRSDEPMVEAHIWNHSFTDTSQSCNECSCPRISVEKTDSDEDFAQYVPEILDNYQLSSETVNDKAFYISEKNFGKFGIWYCNVNSQWFIGLTEEKGQCQGYAYTNSSFSCLCGSSFGWRFIQKKSFTYWKLAKRLSFSVLCNNNRRWHNPIISLPRFLSACSTSAFFSFTVFVVFCCLVKPFYEFRLLVMKGCQYVSVSVSRCQ